MHPDCVLSAALNHTGLRGEVKEAFQEIMADAGLLVAACQRCNTAKGVSETRAIRVVQALAHRHTAITEAFVEPGHCYLADLSQPPADRHCRPMADFALRLVLQRWVQDRALGLVDICWCSRNRERERTLYLAAQGSVVLMMCGNCQPVQHNGVAVCKLLLDKQLPRPAAGTFWT
jgi:hypothetical protein